VNPGSVGRISARVRVRTGQLRPAGRETLNSRTCCAWYLPSNLFGPEQGGPGRTGAAARTSRIRKGAAAQIDERMNKTALVTLWVDPVSAEVMRYVRSLDSISAGRLDGAPPVCARP
jgi:hypothetical protein